MTHRFLEHGLSLLLVGLMFVVVLVWHNNKVTQATRERDSAVQPYLSVDSVDFSNAYHRELFRESAEAFFPTRQGFGDSLLAALDAYQMERFTRLEYKSGVSRTITTYDLLRLGNMFAQFILVFLLALALTALGGRGLAVYRFIVAKQGGGTTGWKILRMLLHPQSRRPLQFVLALAMAFGLVIAGFVVYSPAYVVAYALKGRMDLNSLLFLLLLTVLTNGALVNYAGRYALLLSAAGKEGFVDTAVAKNLSTEWNWSVRGGIPLRAIFFPRRSATGHVFHHIALHAEFHHRSSLKEHAAFLITGLIIIEMALNIQGHLGYELLQNILYRRYDIVATILFDMFLLVKVTALVIDVRSDREERKYANAA